MPRIDDRRLGLAFDMAGCPNRCRHCWLGPASRQTLTEEDVRWGVAQFRGFLAAEETPVRELKVATWFREPDYRDDYRQLHQLEAELSDGPPCRYELLSIWRLARDPEYAAWARSVGPDTCQISFFGLEEATDWFHRRRGAFRDALTATERLLEAGMKPRWQLFLTTRLLPDLDGLLEHVDRLRLRERVAALGGEFVLFMHPPGPDYAARAIEPLRPRADEVADLPEAVLAPSRRHFGRQVLWHTEEELVAGMAGDTTPAGGIALPGELWFFVAANWDVFSNAGDLQPWWCLGNLRRDPVATVVRRFEEEEVLGMRLARQEPPARLAERYGDPRGQRIFTDAGDLLTLYRRRRCEEAWEKE